MPLKPSFDERFEDLFQEHFQRLFRFLARVSGDPDLARDLAQEAFVRLYRRGSPPDAPGSWLITVSLNLFRNVRSKEARRAHLLRAVRAEDVMGDAPSSPGDALGSNWRIRRAIDGMPERERSLLLLRAEGYSYREIAAALSLQEASIGTLLARAKRAFRDRYEERLDAS